MTTLLMLMSQTAEVVTRPLYTADELINIVGSIGIIITALGATIVNVIVALRTGKKVDEQGEKTDELVNQVAQVHTITNSNLAAITSELKKSNELNTQLQLVIDDLKIERDKAAAAAKSQMNVEVVKVLEPPPETKKK